MKPDLGKFNDRRVTVTAIFDRLKYPAGNANCVALVQDATVQADDGTEIDIGHTWVQHADTLVGTDLQSWDRIKFSARVRRYFKDGQVCYGLILPTGVQRVDLPALKIPPPARPAALLQPQAEPGHHHNHLVEDTEPPQEEPILPQPAKDTDPIQAIKIVRAAAREVGGLRRLAEIASELATEI